METMRAGRMVAVGRMECEAVPIPEVGDGDVLVRSDMASICGSDLHLVCMGAGLPSRPPMAPGFPGHEGIGEVVESRSPRVEAGTRVLCFPNMMVGECFSEYQRLGASYCLPVPASDLPVSHLLMAQQLGTVVYARRTHPRDVEGETVVVLGQGSAGLFFTHLLERAGAATVIVSDLSDARLDVSKRYGADVTLNPSRDDVKGAIADLTGGRGADYLVEAVGRAETFLQSTDLVRVGAELLWFGLPSTDDTIPFAFYSFFRRKLRAASIYGAQDEPDAASFREALDMIAGGLVDVSPLVRDVFPIEQIGEAFELAHEPIEAGALKVSVAFDGTGS